MTTYLLLIYYWFTTELLLNYVITVLWTIRTSDPLLFMLDALANASRSRNKLRPRSPFSDEKNAGNRTSTGCTVWNSALCTCAHTHACRKNRACAFLAGFRVVCCLFYRFPVRNALRASQAVHATDVMVNNYPYCDNFSFIFGAKLFSDSTRLVKSYTFLPLYLGCSLLVFLLVIKPIFSNSANPRWTVLTETLILTAMLSWDGWGHSWAFHQWVKRFSKTLKATGDMDRVPWRKNNAEGTAVHPIANALFPHFASNAASGFFSDMTVLTMLRWRES